MRWKRFLRWALREERQGRYADTATLGPAVCAKLEWLDANWEERLQRRAAAHPELPNWHGWGRVEEQRARRAAGEPYDKGGRGTWQELFLLCRESDQRNNIRCER